MYFGGAAPDNQNYSPYNTPEINLAAEGKTGGGVTHRTFESSLLTNVLGSQGTSDRSQWRYHQPVYCKTYTETRRSEVPGLMSTPLRAVYRGGSTSYNYNYGSELLGSRGGVGGGGGGGGGGLYAELEDGVPPPPPPSGESGTAATSFGTFTVNYSVTLDRALPSALENSPTEVRDEWTTQDNVQIFADRVTSQNIEAVVGAGALSPRTIPYVGTATWSAIPANKSVEFFMDVTYGVTFNRNLFNIFDTNSAVRMIKGLACFNFATLVCNNAPFTGQTYGQAIVGYEVVDDVTEFANGPNNINPGVARIQDRYQGEYPLVPPLPGRPWFDAYVTNYGGAGYIPIYRASRTKTVSLVPVNSVKTTLTRVSANRFRLYMNQQAVGGIMVLRYSAAVTPDGTRFTLGFLAPTIVYIPANEREAFFDVTPGAYASYTVTLEKCFGLPDLIDAQFWPLEPDPVQFLASGP
jgi:hypothetical protein